MPQPQENRKRRHRQSVINTVRGNTVHGGSISVAGRDVVSPRTPAVARSLAHKMPSSLRRNQNIPESSDLDSSSGSDSISSSDHSQSSSREGRTRSATRDNADQSTLNPSPPGPSTITESLNRKALGNDADKHLFSLLRPKGKTDLYKITQVEIQYDKYDDVPYSILAFRLHKGDDKEKKCLAVHLKGKFDYDDGRFDIVHIKGICCLPEDGPAALTQVQVQTTTTTTTEVKVGLDSGKPALQARLGRLASVQTTKEAGQHSRGAVDEEKGEFSVDLTLDRGVESELSVVDPVVFALLLRLEKKRQPMRLALSLAVTYRSRRGSRKTLTEVHKQDYPGIKLYDIHKF